MTQDPVAVLGGAVDGFRTFAAAIKAGVPRVRAGSVVESDQQLSGNVVIPHLIASGLIGSVADHLSAWAELADSQDDETGILLHVAADYTLFRPVVEGLIEAIWILDGSESAQRIKRAMDIAKIEHSHGSKFVKDLGKAKIPDDKTAQGIAILERVIRATAQAIELEPDSYLKERAIDPSSIRRKIAHRVSGNTLRTFRFWAITSAHAHGQLISTLRFAQATKLTGVHEGGAHYEADENLLAELVLFITELIDVAVTLLNEQGYELST
jgi:hypothetical protein